MGKLVDEVLKSKKGLDILIDIYNYANNQVDDEATQKVLQSEDFKEIEASALAILNSDELLSALDKMCRWADTVTADIEINKERKKHLDRRNRALNNTLDYIYQLLGNALNTLDKKKGVQTPFYTLNYRYSDSVIATDKSIIPKEYLVDKPRVEKNVIDLTAIKKTMKEKNVSQLKTEQGVMYAKYFGHSVSYKRQEKEVEEKGDNR